MATARAYTPELAAVLQTFGGMQTCVDAGGAGGADAIHRQRLGRESSSLIQLVYRALFGNAAVMEALALYWLETLPHPADPRAPEDEPLAAMVHALATAPAAPCVRVHRVGSQRRYHVVFHPFGVAPGAPTAPLAVPLEHADPRLVRALQHLVMNPWAFRHMDEDPTFGFFTLSCFAYDCEAQQELDACRPVALCAALRAITLRIRRETHRSEHRPRAGAAPAAAVLTYARAATEERLRARLERALMAPGRWAPPPPPPPRGSAEGAGKPRPERELLQDALQFVWHERTATSLPHPRTQEIRRQMARAGVSLPPAAGAAAVRTRDQSLRLGASGGVQYAVLPAHREIYAFSDQVMGEWLRVLHLARARDAKEAPRGAGAG